MANNLPVLRYLGMTKINNASSNTLVEAIDGFLLQKGLPVDGSYKRIYELKSIQEDSEHPDLSILKLVGFLGQMLYIIFIKF